MLYEDINNSTDIPCLLDEVWRDIEGYENFYMISNYGRVKRLAYVKVFRNQVTSWEKLLPEKIYKLNLDSHGYPQVALRLAGLPPRVARVHRLVAEHFLAPPSDNLLAECKAAGLDYVLIDHKDDNPKNPHIDNLRWCSPAYNNKKTEKDYSSVSGSNQYMAILNEERVLEIVELLDNSGLSQNDIAAMYGVKQITISNINTGRSWTKVTGRKPVPRSVLRRETNTIVESELV